MGVNVNMIIRLKEPIDRITCRKLAVDLYEAFNGGFCIDKEEGEHCLYFVTPFAISQIEGMEQYDYSCVAPSSMESSKLLSLDFNTRYYNEGYERGDFYFIMTVAMWLEERIPGCEILYGGDNGEPLVLFNKKKREEIFKYFAKYGHKPFFKITNEKKEGVPYCDFCNLSMNCYAFFDTDKSGWECAGCGYRIYDDEK